VFKVCWYATWEFRIFFSNALFVIIATRYFYLAEEKLKKERKKMNNNLKIFKMFLLQSALSFLIFL